MLDFRDPALTTDSAVIRALRLPKICAALRARSEEHRVVHPLSGSCTSPVAQIKHRSYREAAKSKCETQTPLPHPTLQTSCSAHLSTPRSSSSSSKVRLKTGSSCERAV